MTQRAVRAPARPAAFAAPTAFPARVLSVVRSIPPGRVATYGDVACMAGRPRAWRAVGNIMRTCGDHGVPCHRVIAAGGRLGGYGGNLGLKRELLRAEGLIVARDRVRGFAVARWRDTPLGAALARRAARTQKRA